MNKYLFLSIILTILVLATAFIFWRGAFSRSDVKLEIIGPSEVTCGDEVEFIVKFKNNSNARLDAARLTVEFPQHSMASGSNARVLVKDEGEIGYIYPGEEKSYPFKVRIFGGEGDTKELQALLMYQPQGLKARYPTKTSFLTLVKNVPFNLEYDAQTKIESGREIKLALNYFSNIDFPLSDIKIETEYPSNFDFTSATPKPEGNNLWNIESLNKGNGGRIQIQGYLAGNVGEKKTFNAKIGFWHDGDYIILKKTSFDIGMKEASMDISQTVNDSPQYAATLGETLDYEITFRNIGSDPYKDMILAVRLKGDIFDLNTVRADGGEMSGAGSNTIVWDFNKIPELKFLAPGEEGKVNFQISLRKDMPRNLVNPSLIDRVIIGQTQKEFLTRINSRIDLAQSIQTEDDVFFSEGPLPMSVGKTSVVSVFWELKNYFNDSKNVKVRAIVPQYCEFLGTISPETDQDKVTFDSETREIVWSAGDIKAGTGFGDNRRVIAFQMRVTPPSQFFGQAAVVLENARVSAEDDWTGKNIEFSSGNLTTSAYGEKGIVK